MKESPKPKQATSLLGVLACACFTLQLCLVPLHLALHHHIFVHEHVTVAHTRVDHGDHHHEHRELPRESEDDHDSHPAEDHAQQVVEPAVVRTLLDASLALTPVLAAQLVFDLPAPERADVEVRGPRPRPPRAAATPRAPPVAT